MEDSEWLGALIGMVVFVMVLLAIVGIGWQTRARAVKRWKSLLDLYARREIVREARKKARRRIRMPTSPT